MVRLLSAVEAARWDKFVADHPLGTIYHTSAWRELIQRTYGYEPVYGVREEGGQLVAGLPLFSIRSRLTGTRLLSIPGAQACDPLVRDQADYDTLLRWALQSLSQGSADSIEFRMTHRFQWQSETPSTTQHAYSCYDLALPTDFGLLDKDIRRRIRKADASGIRVVTGETLDDVRHFYRLYLALRRRLGLLPPPAAFFENMWSLLRPARQIEVLHAERQGRIVSSLILLIYKDTATYEYAATDPAFTSLGASPYLLWEAIARASASGCSVFDFGRTGDDNHGLNQFKKQWGVARQPLTYRFIPEMSSAATLRHGRQAKALMMLAIRNTPERVCEVLGRALYRHLA